MFPRILTKILGLVWLASQHCVSLGKSLSVSEPSFPQQKENVGGEESGLGARRGRSPAVGKQGEHGQQQQDEHEDEGERQDERVQV